jgi:hypothetical protein
MSKFFIWALAINSFKYLGTNLITGKPLLIALLVGASMGRVWWQCAGEVSTDVNAASCTARNISSFFNPEILEYSHYRDYVRNANDRFREFVSIVSSLNTRSRTAELYAPSVS